MKRISFLFLAAGLFFLTSCDTTREITLNKDGSGSLVSTTDLSSLIGMAKMAGQSKDMDKLNERAIDTTIQLNGIADSIPELTPQDIALVKSGTLGLVMNMADEKFVTKLQFPFQNADQLGQLDKLSGKVMQQAIKKQMGGDKTPPPGMDADMPEGSVDDYYTTSYTKGSIEKKLIKEKYADIGNDKGMQSMKEVSTQGLPMNTIIIIHLPSPAKKIEGSSAKLSEDKKTVTITNSMEDFFDDGAKLEFSIKY
jgi:hypothetical protein